LVLGQALYIQCAIIDSLNMKTISILFWFIAFSTVAQPLWLNEGLIAHYPFDGVFNDVTRNGYDPAVSQVAFAVDRFGRERRAASFSGQNSSFIEVDGLLDDYSLATVSLWASWSGETIEKPDQQIFNKPRLKGETGLSLNLNSSSEVHSIRAELHPTSFQPGINMNGGELPVSETWNHYVLVHDGRGLTLYVNGEKSNHAGFSRFEFLSEIPFQIGRLGLTSTSCCGTTSTGHFFGKLDDLRVYERDLSETEVRQLFELESNNGETKRHAAAVVPEVIDGALVRVEIMDGGYGYINPPAVTITGGGGSGAMAVALVSAGRVTAIQITNTGSGYTNALLPLITVEPPPKPVTRATATAQIVNGFVVGMDLLDPGYGYTDPPDVTIVNGGGNGSEVLSIVEEGRVVGFEIVNPGRGYSENSIVQIDPPPFAPEISLHVKTVELNLHLVIGNFYVIEGSDNFSHWTPVSDPFEAESEFMTFDYGVETKGKYYRVVEAP
jgi:hypothetical protein